MSALEDGGWRLYPGGGLCAEKRVKHKDGYDVEHFVVSVDTDGDLHLELYEFDGGAPTGSVSGFVPRAIVEELYRRFDAAKAGAK